jgi:hypothetical protein
MKDPDTNRYSGQRSGRTKRSLIVKGNLGDGDKEFGPHNIDQHDI